VGESGKSRLLRRGSRRRGRGRVERGGFRAECVHRARPAHAELSVARLVFVGDASAAPATALADSVLVRARNVERDDVERRMRLPLAKDQFTNLAAARANEILHGASRQQGREHVIALFGS